MVVSERVPNMDFQPSHASILSGQPPLCRRPLAGGVLTIVLAAAI
jgi:hypothetical protein